ncbi:MAG: hypothetical protein ACRDD1_06395, partial [Planctomycetia bacterium]
MTADRSRSGALESADGGAPARREAAVGRWAVVAAAALWSSSGAFVKNIDLPGPSIAFYRAAFAGLFLLAVLRLGR